jgi:two-component system, cell cycle sensor histidine kinase and response regulator CckA
MRPLGQTARWPRRRLVGVLAWAANMRSATKVQEATATLRQIQEQLGEISSISAAGEISELRHALDDLRSLVSWSLAPRTPTNNLTPGPAPHEIERSLRITQESVDSAPIGIFRLDGDGRIASVNQEGCRCLGYTYEELQSLTIFDINPNVSREEWKAHRALTRTTGARTITTTHRCKDGSIFPVEVSIKQFLFEGELFSVSFVKDITERVTAERERAKLESRMLQSQKLESLGVLAGGIAHDFNNLLMAIIGNLELALSEIPASCKEGDMLQEADRAAKQAADLCRQLLIYAGRGSSKVEPTDVGVLLREQTQMLEVTASKRVRLLLNLADSLPQINADVSQLRQVFMNLIINASDAIGESPGVISITTSTLRCDKEYLEGVDSAQPLASGQYVSVEVSDTGCGMAANVREKIFDPFFSTKTSGRGLGLAAVRGIVNKHGGGIRVYSEPGKGTTFRLLFPVPKALVSPAEEPQGTEVWRGSGLVLLIDDELALRSLGSRMLRRLGFDTLVACNGVEGLALFNQRSAEIEYVLLDWTMPEMGGGETLRELRRVNPDVRVVLASGHAPDDILRLVGVGRASAFVRKPYNLGDLAQAFRQASGAG